MRIPFLTVLLLIPLLIGCAGTVKPIQPKSTVFDEPAVDRVTERELGDTLIDKGIIRTYDAIITTEPTVGHWGISATMRAEAGVFVAVNTTSYGTTYRSQTPIAWQALLGSGFADGGIVIPHDMTNTSRSTSTSKHEPSSRTLTNAPHMFFMLGIEQRKSEQLRALSYTHGVADQVLPGSFRQELIYNGRTGDSVKFLYRELKDSYLRAPFTQEVTYDLKDSDVIGFKGARLKVIEATNTKIKYSVSKTFDGQTPKQKPPLAERQ